MSTSLKRKETSTSVVSTETPAVIVHKVLRRNGLYPSDIIGCAAPGVSGECGLGILRGEPYERPDALVFKGRRRRDFIGVVRFDSDRLGATEEQWVLEVYGCQNMELAKKLSREIATITGNSIPVVLSSEEQKKEALFTDFA